MSQPRESGWYVFHKHAMWLCIVGIFVCGLIFGFGVGALVLR